MTLTGCASSGARLPAKDDGIDLPPIPSDLTSCFERHVPAPPRGKISKRELFGLVASLKGSADEKDQCGLRLGCWYDDVARGLAPAKGKRKADAVCAALQGRKP